MFVLMVIGYPHGIAIEQRIVPRLEWLILHHSEYQKNNQDFDEKEKHHRDNTHTQ